jgi:tetratricopeptide (TPR) repeat protein
MSLIAFYASRLSGAISGIRSESGFARNRLAPILLALLAVALVLFPGSRMSSGVESNTPPLSPGPIDETNSQALIRAYSQLQDRIHAAQLAIEQNGQQIKEAAALNADALSKALHSIQETFAAQRARELEAMQKASKVLLVAAGTFAALGFLIMLLIAWLQWRTNNGLAELSAALPTALGLGAGSAVAALGRAEQSNLRLLGAMEQLDQRVHDFKRAVSPHGDGDLARGLGRRSTATGAEPPPADEHARISLLLNQADSLMHADNPEAALACLEGVLSLDPNHTDALVKKGAALERLHKLNEALECYDRAIAVDGSMTLAYLHKGGLCNRLERFKEALDCYGKALLAHDQRGG